MKIDVYVINARNTSHEVNMQETNHDFTKNAESVKNVRMQNIVNTEKRHDMQKTVNIKSEKES